VPYTVLVVCTGNIGRSPLAAALARAKLAGMLRVPPTALEDMGIRVLSAGTRAPEGMAPSSRGIAIAAERGIGYGDHRSTRLTGRLLDDADRIFCMAEGQVGELREMGVDDKVELLDPDGEEIPDPRGMDLDFYRQVCDRIEDSLNRRLPQLVAEARGRL